MKFIDGKIFREMILSGSNNLTNNRSIVDKLNVFPVPDGDTGTNMYLTFNNGLNEISKNDTDDLNTIAKIFSKGLLMGARGNSGVILSQIFRGFYNGIENKESINSLDLLNCFKKGSEVAYKAVMKPVEGTILTVIREATSNTEQQLNNNLVEVEEFIDIFYNNAKVSLENTPNLLPILKDANVVDSGGCGLVYILEGFRSYILGNPVNLIENREEEKEVSEDIETGYNIEFELVLNSNFVKIYDEKKFKDSLNKLGSISLYLKDNDSIKIKMNSMLPGEVLNKAQRIGEFVDVSIHNVDEFLGGELKEYGFISVSSGDGLKDLFKKYNVDIVINGGQTMNPSTEDFDDAIRKINAKNIFILPNNSNIILAAKQASKLVKNKNVIVIETKSIIEGISACLMFNPDDDVKNNIKEMNSAIRSVKSGQVTYSIKDTKFDGVDIKANDYMGINGKKIVASNSDLAKTTKLLLDSLIDEDDELVTLIYGKDVSDEIVNDIKDYIENTYDFEVEVVYGGQPIYSFFIGVE